MKENLKNKHIVLDFSKAPNELVCNICLERQVLPVGQMRIDIYLAIGKAFIKIHKRCKEKANENY